ncbi:unnamed protein product [Pleuronectes platessa]|uniref:RETREG1-3/ARL6IP-like N-terminal reticulon-homology domain-containing protein n=1 Tax=Pleuronectes platessa TaxID=8262 RepID=A0A9N7VBK4_PLEPL|nr:unnamed protein product [Pleuronectes platessa]
MLSPSLNNRLETRWPKTLSSWEIIDSGQDGRSGSGPHLSDSINLFLQETSAFKQQNPGKFCLLVCSLCTFFAVLGRYIPGMVILYILVLGVFLWPLISSHDIGLWLEPVLQKLDFGIGELLQKIKENHVKRMMQTQTEAGVESDLSSMFPQLDSTACKDMSVSDTEVSEVTWTDNGTFNLSEGHTPQTENSEDLDREEAFLGGLQEFPSLDNGTTTNGDDSDDLGLPLPIKSKHTPPPHKDQSDDRALELVNQMAGDFIAAASTRLLELAEESDSEVEDFELLDQSELEQLEGELGLGEKKTQVKEEAPAKTDGSASTGFFTKLLRRQ